MIAFVLDRLGRDPSFLIGGEIPQLGGNARAGSGWLVVEGDESDRTIEHLRPEIAVVTNVDLDHHSTFASAAEVEELFERWLGRRRRSCAAGTSSSRSTFELAVPGEHNRRNAAAALAALELAGVPRDEARRRARRFRGRGPPLRERGGEAGGVTRRTTTTRTTRPRSRRRSRAARGGGRARRVLVLFQPHLYSRTRHLAQDLGAALASADAAAVTEIYRAREEPGGRRERQARRRRARRASGRGCRRRLDAGGRGRGARFSRARARPGDLVLTIGAGDVDRAAPLLLEELA